MPVAGEAAGSEDDVTEPSGDTSPAPHDAPTHPLDPWGVWIVRWLGAMLTVSFLAITLLLALDRNGWSVAWMIIWALPIAFLVAVLTVVASTLRWLLSRFAPPDLQDAILPVVVLGALAGAVPLWLFFFGGDPTAFTGRTLREALASGELEFVILFGFSFLLLYGHLPTMKELTEWRTKLTGHSLIHEDMKKFFEGFPASADITEIVRDYEQTALAHHG
jgi:hypothetical protein